MGWDVDELGCRRMEVRDKRGTERPFLVLPGYVKLPPAPAHIVFVTLLRWMKNCVKFFIHLTVYVSVSVSVSQCM